MTPPPSLHVQSDSNGSSASGRFPYGLRLRSLPCAKRLIGGGWCRVRTSDPCRVKTALCPTPLATRADRQPQSGLSDLRGSGAPCGRRMTEGKRGYLAHLFQVFKTLNRSVKPCYGVLWQRARAAVFEFFLEVLLGQRVIGGAPKRLVDLGAEAPAVLHLHFHFRAEVVVGGKLVGGVRRDADARQQSLHRRVLVGIAFKVFDHDLAVGHRAGEAVLQAELGVEFALRFGAVGVLEAPRVGPGFDALDLIRLQIVLAREREHRIQRRMRAAAAGILLDRDARLHDIERIGPVCEDARDIVCALAVEHVEETLLVFECARRVRGESGARELCGEKAAPRAMADVERFHHGAEVGLDAGGKRGGDGERGARAFFVEPHQL